ncbi:phosphofructokinase PFKII [Toxoplasma gondii ME49]|uniref:Pyrophosphate--fructose 6-phosphate 1-phosphotransferase n=26 Tax=Toxoplasma gondii TaxID=5811 RepID=B9Q857_TOXGV|nr:phosphofructokinase PFKII [Toxoplasma gondii ME49]EPR62328.1 phosphofructokinase PFKII [Toxoplasma gondii GT1]ESS32680.1 phosphofructokinase PFKII [Toxoplasma gondii VEG]KFG60969.1 phosphofructokinase PFKII [Toxoplasma gondii RUB]PIL95855.1 phosphofructokinase PFKII [Toxoplasma gondii COUG]EPT27193.1 phosphofructokinase PFKII [Toxoplasma gondii ME49]|eukprot:XP_002366349.1 phosphofructokinase PFKII [Toxoplasma gondii ME49]
MTFLSFFKCAKGTTSAHPEADAVETFFESQASSQSHLFSPQLADEATPNEVARRHFKPVLPPVFSSPTGVVTVPCNDTDLVNKQDEVNNAPHVLSAQDQDILASLFPNTINTNFCLLAPASGDRQASSEPLRVGVVLSGGQAAGGHNVICGIFDYVKRVNPASTVFGFLGGPHGVFSHEYVELTEAIIDKYRNMGGFDMIRSGRHKIETDEQKQKSLEICEKLQLNGLVVIGGDDSNTNAAILAEYFKSKGSSTSVCGCPKTIDGDLKNRFVEISFGFDTACKTYCQQIGNLMRNAMTGGNTYHFVRLMGRSASLITLECALQTHPNYTFIGEEVMAKKQSLRQLVEALVDLVEARYAKGKQYGVVLLPEGLIEFIPEVGVLINEINHIVAAGDFEVSKLTPESRSVFEELPESTRRQLLLDRDPHGNVQVAMIHTEKLLMQMTESELQKRGFQGTFLAQSHYLGYEGRSGYPSDFDATYCYGLGNVAGALIQNKVTACMAVLKDMSSSSNPLDWKAAGIPLTKMMNLETRKGKANVPVIKKFLVDIERPLFQAFAQVRDAMRLEDVYQIPGPMQLNTPTPVLPYTLVGAPSTASLLSSSSPQSLGHSRLEFEPLLNPLLLQKETAVVAGAAAHPGAEACNAHIQALFPALGAEAKDFFGGACKLQKAQKIKEKCAVGVVLVGPERPGYANVLCGLVQRVALLGGTVKGFKGARGLLTNDCVVIGEKEAAAQRNQPGFVLLGRTEREEAELFTKEGMKQAAATLQAAGVAALVMIGGTTLHAAVLSELLASQRQPIRVVCVEPSGDLGRFPAHGALQLLKELTGKDIVVGSPDAKAMCPGISSTFQQLAGCRGLGFDTETKVASEMIANLLTDSNSAAKYFYFCQVSGGLEAECEVGLQTHPNVVLSSQQFKTKTLGEIVTFVADAVKARAALKKNFGVAVINENLFALNKELRDLAVEIHLHFLTHPPQPASGVCLALTADEEAALMAALSPASRELFTSLPVTFQHKLIRDIEVHQFPKAILRFPAHELIAAMVAAVLKKEKDAGTFSGSFSPLCFEFSDSLRASYPSLYDCSLGSTLGHLSAMCATMHALPSHAVQVSVANPTSCPTVFEPLVLPLAASAAQLHGLCVSSAAVSETPANGVFSVAEGDALFALSESASEDAVSQLVAQGMQSGWVEAEKYCNPGPLQFAEPAKDYYYSRSLFEVLKGAMKSEACGAAACRDQ